MTTDDETPYGRELAVKTAAKLKTGRRLMYEHRDFCGMGLGWKRGSFYYLYVSDGDFLPGDPWLPERDERRFLTEEEFVAWLASQSDATLSGRTLGDPGLWDNQRITRARLTDFVGESPA